MASQGLNPSKKSAEYIRIYLCVQKRKIQNNFVSCSLLPGLLHGFTSFDIYSLGQAETVATVLVKLSQLAEGAEKNTFFIYVELQDQ